MKPTLVFDYDGTIHNTMVIYESAFRNTYEWLVNNGYSEKRELSSAQIASWLGLNSKEMWNQFMPQLPKHIKEEASRQVGEDMVRQIKNHKAVWYPGARSVLDELSLLEYRMVILSNCKIAYREANWTEFAMERWFSAFYDCESYHFAPKTRIIQEVQKQFPGPYVVIGDRKTDMECAKACKSPFIGCTYGFGEKTELLGATHIIETIEQLPKILENI